MSISSPEARGAASTGPGSSRERLVKLFEPWGCNCECRQCQTASGPGQDLPCWFMTNKATALFLWEAYRNMTLDPDPLYKSIVMQLFNQLVSDKHDGYESDLLHLFKIPAEKFCAAVLRDSSAWTTDTWMVVELGHLLILAVWKMHRGGPEAPPELFRNRVADWHSLYVHILVMSYRLFIISMLPTVQKIHMTLLPTFNAEYNSKMAQIFVVGNHYFPWIECYLHSFRSVLKMLWLKSPNAITKEKFTYPSLSTLSKRAEMQVSMLPRMPKKKLSCSECGTQLSRLYAKFWGVEHELCENPHYFPREVLRLDRPADKWDTFPEVDAAKRSVVVVCSFKCLLEAERTRYPSLNAFMKKFNSSKLSSLVKYGEPSIDTLEAWQEDPKNKADYDECRTLALNIVPTFIQTFMSRQLPFFPDTAEGEHSIPLPVWEDECGKRDVKANCQEYFGLKDWPLFDRDMRVPWEGEARHELLKSYRAALRRACNPAKFDDVDEIAMVVKGGLAWRREYTNFSKFTQRDHQTDITVGICNSMQKFQPLPEMPDALKLLMSLFRSPYMLFLPVDSTFVCLRHVREGVKFVVLDPSRELKALADANDYILISSRFDIKTASCNAAVLFKENGILMGVIIRDGYSFFMENIPLNVFVESYSTYELTEFTYSGTLPKMKDDSKKEDRIKLGVLFMLSHVLYMLEQKSMRDIGLSTPLPKTRKIEISFDVRKFRKLDDVLPSSWRSSSWRPAPSDKITQIRWISYAITDCPMKIAFQSFAERLGEQESAFLFYLGNEKFDGSSSLAPGTATASFRAVLKDSSGELTDFFCFQDKTEIFLAETPLTRLSAIMINTSTQAMLRLLVPSDLSLESLTKSLVVTGLGFPSSDMFSWYCRTNDQTLLKMPAVAASSLHTVADYVGVDPVRMELVFTMFSFEGDRIKPALPFERAPLNVNAFKATKHSVVWAGQIALHEHVPLVCPAWIWMPSTLSSAEQKSVLKMAERWLPSFDLMCTDHPMTVLNIGTMMGGDKSFELLVSFLPVWHKGASANRDVDMVAKLRKQREKTCLSFTHQNGSFGWLYYNETRDVFILRLAKDVKEANRVMESMLMGNPFPMPSMGACNPVASLKASVVGVMTFFFDTCPSFCVILSQGDADMERLFDARYSPHEASHCWLEVETPLATEAVMRSNAQVQNLIVDALTAFNSQPLFCDAKRQFLALPGTTEDIRGLLSRGERVRLAESMLLVTFNTSQRTHNGHWLSKDARFWLAGLLCDGRSPLFVSGLKEMRVQEKADFNRFFKKPDLAEKWTASLKRAEERVENSEGGILGHGADFYLEKVGGAQDERPSETGAARGAKPKERPASQDSRANPSQSAKQSKLPKSDNPKVEPPKGEKPKSEGAKAGQAGAQHGAKQPNEPKSDGAKPGSGASKGSKSEGAKADQGAKSNGAGALNRAKMVKMDKLSIKQANVESLAKMDLLFKHLSTRVRSEAGSVAASEAAVAEARASARQEVAASGPSIKLCTFCRKQALEMLVCGGCKVTHYCCKKCQTSDWKNHKADCRETHKSMMRDLVKLL